MHKVQVNTAWIEVWMVDDHTYRYGQAEASKNGTGGMGGNRGSGGGWRTGGDLAGGGNVGVTGVGTGEDDRGQLGIGWAGWEIKWPTV